MVQNKKVGAGLTLIAGLLGMCVSDAALARPEVFVGSRLVQNGSSASTQTTSDDSTEVIASDDSDSVAADDGTNEEPEESAP